MNPGGPGYWPPTMRRKKASGGRSRREPRDRTGWMLTLGVEAIRVRHARGRRGIRDDAREVEYQAPWRDSWPFRSASTGRRSSRYSKPISTRRGAAGRHSGSGSSVPGGGFPRAACLREELHLHVESTPRGKCASRRQRCAQPKGSRGNRRHRSALRTTFSKDGSHKAFGLLSTMVLPSR